MASNWYPVGQGGRTSVVAQFGGMGFAFLGRGRNRNLKFSHLVTTGNEACIKSLGLVDHLIDADEADLFLLFIEDVKTSPKLPRVAAKTLVAGKPLLVTK